MSLKLAQGLSFLKRVSGLSEEKVQEEAEKELLPTLKLQTDKQVYRPGDSVTATIEICNTTKVNGGGKSGESHLSFLVDVLSFDLKGIEKLEIQWFSIPKPIPPAKQKRGEHSFLDCTVPTIISKVVLASGQTKRYLVRAELPKNLPPSYRGSSIRYIYYVRVTLHGRWAAENGDQNRGPVKNTIKLQARAPLQIWPSQRSSDMLSKDGMLAFSVDQLNIYWREKDEDSEWTRANENTDAFEEEYDSSRDETSSVFSYNPVKTSADSPYRNSFSMQLTSRLSTGEPFNPQGERASFPAYAPLPRLSASEVLDDSAGGPSSPHHKLNNSLSNISSNAKRISLDSNFNKDDGGSSSATPKHVEQAGSEGFVRGRSYNIRIDGQTLLRFSPKNSDSIYYFGDMIGGILTFFHGEGIRRCLEVSITLETSETVNQRVIHLSRRGSPTITKVHSEHHEVVADIQQTSFLFSIPFDGPMTFSTSKVSIQWSLRFEFFTTPGGLDLSRYEHPLLVEQRERGDWVLPIMVYAPPLRRQPQHATDNRPFTFGNFLHS